MSISQLFRMRCSGYAANDWSICETKNRPICNCNFFLLAPSFRFFPFILLVLSPPHPPQSAQAPRPSLLSAPAGLCGIISFTNAFNKKDRKP